MKGALKGTNNSTKARTLIHWMKSASLQKDMQALLICSSQVSVSSFSKWAGNGQGQTPTQVFMEFEAYSI